MLKFAALAHHHGNHDGPGSREPEAAERPLTPGGVSDHFRIHIRMPILG